jgi:uncharacterized protein
MNFNLHDRTIFLVLAGSHAYGFATPESDHDYRGIVIPPLDSYIGLQSKFEQCVDTDKSKAASQHFPAGVLEADADVQVMELTKLVRLACQNNPSILEILFTDEQHWIIKKDVMNKLLEHRDKLLSKACKARFCGYALSQLKRIKRHKKWLDNPPDHQPTREEFGLPDRSLLSQDQMGAAEALIQKEIDEFMVDQTHLPEDVKIELDQGMGRMMRAVWQTIYPGLDYPVGDGKSFESTDEALFWGAARDQEFSDNFLEALNREKKYRAAKREWDSYQRWLVQRNPKRAEIEKKFGFDLKHATHLVRLLKMAREILEKKQVNVLRPDAEELLAIRNGAWSYEQIVEFAEREDEALNEVAKKCDLPKVAPIDFFHDIVQDMILEFNQTEVVTPAVAYGAPMPIYGAVLEPGTFRQRYYQLVVTHMNPLKKIPVIKFFRELTGWGLYEAKLAFEHGRWAAEPTCDIEEARTLKTKFDELGCKSVIEMFDIYKEG